MTSRIATANRKDDPCPCDILYDYPDTWNTGQSLEKRICVWCKKEHPLKETNRNNLMPGMRAIIKYLEDNEKVTRKKLYFNLDYSAKYIQTCLTRLSNNNMIDTVPNLEDMRKVFYVLVTIK